MIVYHGSYLVVDKPDVNYSKKYLDFGAGFYITADQKQAEIWAKRKGLRQKAPPIVNVYNLNDDLSAYNGLIFEHEDVAWLDFVAKCRKGNLDYIKYDYISGSVANDDVFQTVDLNMRGIWDSIRALSEIRYYDTSHQICTVNQLFIDNEISFSNSYEVM
jgi:hypothetical protein